MDKIVSYTEKQHGYISLYIHFPWCLRKCPYCDFNSYGLASIKEVELFTSCYVQKLLIDFKLEHKNLEEAAKKVVGTIYFGGGTPTLLGAKNIKAIIGFIKDFYHFSNNIEITCEVNPETLTTDICGDLEQAGINRISLGIQSFNDYHLKFIKRIHDARRAKEAVLSIGNNFTNFNIDIMFGLPNQTIYSALDDLERALDYNPTHLSWYQLTIEENTEFAKYTPLLPELEKIWEIQQIGQELISKRGYIQYEVSAYSIPGMECQHNINYWQYGDYMGIGSGAYGKVTLLENKVLRYWKITDPIEYLKANLLFYEGKQIVSKREQQFEFMLNALRLSSPIAYELFYKRTGSSIEEIRSKLEYAQDLGLLRLEEKYLMATKKGRNFLNDLLEIFI